MGNVTTGNDPASCRELVQRVAASDSFRKSPRQRELFLYLCQQSLDHPGVEVNEHRVGTEVFGRQPDYDTSQDTLVRVHVSDLRKRLKTYFDTAGVDSTLTIEIPKGRYTAVFSVRQPEPPPAAAVLPALPLPVPQTAAMTRRQIVLTALAIVLTGLLAWWARGAWDDRASKGALFSAQSLNLLWSRFDHADERTWLVVADSAHGLVQDLQRRAVPLNDYAGRDYWTTNDPDPIIGKLKTREYSGLADLGLARRIAVGFGPHEGRVQTVFARHFQMRMLNTDNSILVGSKRSNPWVEVFEPSMNFRFDYEEATGRALVRNLNPKSGEQPVYPASIASDPVKQGYATVAFLPNLRRTGSVLIISGTSTAETETAGFFITSEEQFARFVSSLPLNSRQRLPYFELLLKTQRVGQNPRQVDIVAWRLPSM